MSLIKRLFGQNGTTTPVRATVEIYAGDRPLEVKGEASYQAELEAIAGPKRDHPYKLPVVAVLVRQPDNEYDSNAIAVYATHPDGRANARMVGYINRKSARQLAPVIDRKNAAGETVGLKGTIVGGWDRGYGDEGHYGIWLTYTPADFA